MSIEPISNDRPGFPGAPPADDMARFLARAGDPLAELEALILEDSATQQRAALGVRRTNRELRHRALEEAVKKMKDAANNRFYSAIASSLVNVAATLVGMKFDALVKAGSEVSGFLKYENVALKGLEAGASRFNPFDLAAAEHDRRAEENRLQSQESGERAQEVESWLASAREIERKMIERLDSLRRAEHETRMSFIGK